MMPRYQMLPHSQSPRLLPGPGAYYQSNETPNRSSFSNHNTSNTHNTLNNNNSNNTMNPPVPAHDLNLNQQSQQIPVPSAPSQSTTTITADNDKEEASDNEMDEQESTVQSANINDSDVHGKLALLMHEKWLKRILYYGKSWEIRGRNTHIRGKIYLAFKDHIYGETQITDCFPITKEELKANFNLHHVEDLSIVTYKTPHIWMLDNTKRYNKPIKFPRKKGQIVFCSVNMDNLRGNEIIETVVNTNKTKRALPKSKSPKSKKPSKRRKIAKANKSPSKATPKIKKTPKKSKTVSRTQVNESKATTKKDVDLKGFIDPEDGALTTIEPDLSKALTDKQWEQLIDTDIFSCCNKKVGGSAVMCDECDGEWHIYCLRWKYHFSKKEMNRIQKDGESYICVDCYRHELGKIRKI